MQLDDLLDQVDNLGTLPAVHREVTEALGDPGAPIERFGWIIGHDMDLTARLLRLANSPFYGFPGHIETIEQAITLIGLEPLRNLVTATTVVEFFNEVSPDVVDLHSFWRHSVACGLAARCLGMRRRDPNPERLFVSGLLHDVGRLLLCVRAPEPFNHAIEQMWATNRPLFECEREVLGFDHAEVGGGLLERWHFPTSVIHSVLRHHQPLEEDEWSSDACLVHCADLLVLSLELGNSGQVEPPPLVAGAWDTVGLPVSSLEDIATELNEQVNSVTATFVRLPVRV